MRASKVCGASDGIHRCKLLPDHAGDHFCGKFCDPRWDIENDVEVDEIETYTIVVQVRTPKDVLHSKSALTLHPDSIEDTAIRLASEVAWVVHNSV